MTVGDRIRNRRNEMKLSMEDLANLIGKKAPVIYKYENDMIDMPASAIKALHKTLGLSYFELLDDDISEDSEIIEAYNDPYTSEDTRKAVRAVLGLQEKQKTPVLESSTE